MADASVTGGVHHPPADGGQSLPTLTAEEEQAARLALTKLGAGSGTLTSGAVGHATLHGAGGSDTLVVGSGSATLVAGAAHPSLLSGADRVEAGSGVPVQADSIRGGGFHHPPGQIEQAGPTAAGIKAAQQPTPAGATMPDKTKINVSGVTPADIAKHSGGHG
jgi:hypothetical protein